MPVAVGDILDSKYRLLKRLGGGAFGDIYLAEDALAKRQVAIKMLKVQNPADQQDLIHEMQSLHPVQHPNIVAFYHHFFHERLLFLVMEYCGGGTLRSRMASRPFTQQAAFELGRTLAEALRFVHDKGVIHHDIKPDNILLASDGSLKIGDFGIANRHGGTRPYMAPELSYRGADPTDARADIYALGITILELLKNRNPFDGMSPSEVLPSKLQHDFIPSGLDRWVEEVLAKATHPSPELRFQTMREFKEAIDAKHVAYVFDRSLVQAHALAGKAEQLLASGRPAAASKCITQALFASPDCIAALVAAGRYNLYINRVEEARRYLDRALKLNPRIHIQKELGWMCLESGNYPQAISMLTDHLQRNAADYEAFNLLLECFYRTERYDTGVLLAKMMIEEKAPSECFYNNGLLCRLFSATLFEDFPQSRLRNPILEYNGRVANEDSELSKRHLLFQTYRHGMPSNKRNTLSVSHHDGEWELQQPVISIGSGQHNELILSGHGIDRRHCLLVNFLDDVWIYDLGSAEGVIVDGRRIQGKAYLNGVHTVKLGDAELVLKSKLGLLA